FTGVGITLCYSDEDVCQVDTGTGTGTGTSPAGTDEGTSTGDDGLTTTSFTPKPAKGRKKKTTGIAVGTGIPIFVIFWAIVAFLAINHQKKKAAAAGKMNATSGQPGVNLPDVESAAQNIFPDDHGVNTDQQTHPT
ncbi:hypothetical protein MKW94_007790, partial [Papaver nudicaule]|nr:hypothetical protein [Papaver nudicaule]